MTTLVTPVRRASSQTAGCSAQEFGAGSIACRLTAFAELAKPRIALMVLLTMGIGYVLASRGIWQPVPFLNACVGVFLAVVSASSLNQLIERQTDARMERTRQRPLPAGRLTSREVALFGFACGAVSCLQLYWLVNPLTAGLTLFTIVSYAAVYTPLKRYTSVCTALGAIPGALPPVLGWTAAGGSLNWEAFSLFAVLFVWQFPHFLAIAWMYREQYEQAGLKMLPGRGRARITGTIALSYALALLPVSLLPVHYGLGGDFYGVVAVVLGMVYAVATFRFYWHESRATARQVLFVSLGYLPCVLMALMFDHLRLLQAWR